MSNLKDVAKLADVSIATVSRVLNGSATVSDEKKQCVMSAVKKLNFRPNLTASSLRARDSKIIALIMPGRTHATFGMNTSYIADACQKNGYSLLIGLHHDKAEMEASLLDNVIRRNIDGIIIATTSEENLLLKMVEEHNIPIVVIDRVLQSGKFSCVSIDNYRAGYMAGAYLASLGHRKIGCITMPVNIWQCYQRILGFKDALNDHDIEIIDHYILEVPSFSFDAGVQGAQTLIAQKDGGLPTALWAQEDHIAAGAMRAFINAGYRIPDDISIMGMDNLDIAHMLSPGLTTISYPFKEISNRAVNCILQYYRDGQDEKKQYLFDPQIICRESTAPPHP